MLTNLANQKHLYLLSIHLVMALLPLPSVVVSSHAAPTHEMKKVTKKGRVLPNITNNNNNNSNNGEGKKNSKVSSNKDGNVKLPKIKTASEDPPAPASPVKKIHYPISHVVKSPKKRGPKEPAYLDSPSRSPPINFNRMDSQSGLLLALSPRNNSSSVEAVKSKLNVLEQSLTAKRIVSFNIHTM